jgi:hypothetical protein
VVEDATSNILSRRKEVIDPPIPNSLWIEVSVESKILKVLTKSLSLVFIVFHADGRRVAGMLRFRALRSRASRQTVEQERDGLCELMRMQQIR